MIDTRVALETSMVDEFNKNQVETVYGTKFWEVMKIMRNVLMISNPHSVKTM
jgi:hypothetical protein